MESFSISIPTRIYFGRGILGQAFRELEDKISGNVLVVTTGRSLIRLGHLGRLLEQLQGLPGVTGVSVYDGVSADPRLTEVGDGIAYGRKQKADLVVGFGGGSALDAAKAIAAGIAMDVNAEELFSRAAAPGAKALPVIAVPTTAGTGSELSKAAILTYGDSKTGVRGQVLYPAAAIVDPAFTDTAPFQVTMETGFDVFAHGVESYLSLAGNDFTRELSEQAVRLVTEYLPRLAEDLLDREARDRMSYASMLMGINLGNASTCLPHRLQYPLGAKTGSSHGLGLALLYPAWVECEYPYSTERLDRIAEIMNRSRVQRRGGAGQKNALETVEGFIEKIGLRRKLSDFQLSGADIPELAARVSGNLGNDPASREPDIIQRIYQLTL